MHDNEKLLWLRSLEVRVQDEEDDVNRAKDSLKVAKDAFDTAVNELRLAVRKPDEDEAQMTIPFSDAIILDESRQIPENKTTEEEEQKDPLALPERPEGEANAA